MGSTRVALRERERPGKGQRRAGLAGSQGLGYVESEGPGAGVQQLCLKGLGEEGLEPGGLPRNQGSTGSSWPQIPSWVAKPGGTGEE